MKAGVKVSARAERVSAPKDLQPHHHHLVRLSRDRTTTRLANTAALSEMKRKVRDHFSCLTNYLSRCLNRMSLAWLMQVAR
jgi:hypothetical protein